MPWEYVLSSKRYRDADTKRFLARSRILELVETSIAASTQVSDDLATGVRGERPTIDASRWRDEMRKEIKEEYLRQYMLGRGGRGVMDRSDWGRVGGIIREQYRHLDEFFAAIESGQLSERLPEGMRDAVVVIERMVGLVPLTEAQVRARAQMYLKSAREAYERAHAVSLGVPRLPAYPGDGTTICLTSCTCNWDCRPVTNDEGAVIAWECFWILNRASEHCETCEWRASNWNPYRVTT